MRKQIFTGHLTRHNNWVNLENKKKPPICSEQLVMTSSNSAIWLEQEVIWCPCHCYIEDTSLKYQWIPCNSCMLMLNADTYTHVFSISSKVALYMLFNAWFVSYAGCRERFKRVRNHIWTFISCTLTCPYYSSPKIIFASSVSLIIVFFYYHP